MTAHKFLTGLTITLVFALLLGGIYAPNTLVMSLADTTTTYTVLRSIVIVMLISLLVIRPPRSFMLRSVIGVFSIGLGALSLQLMLNYEMNLLDTIVFMELAVIFAIEALESPKVLPIPRRRAAPKRIPVFTT